MLIRFTVENVFSFGEKKEFNMIPYDKLKTLKHHCYKDYDVDLLKMTSIYGANAAGKSNLIKAIEYMQVLVLNADIPFTFANSEFKFNEDSEKKPQLLAIEFIESDTTFYYAIELLNGLIKTEELYKLKFNEGKATPELIFERKTNEEGETTLKFNEIFDETGKSKLIKEILIDEFIKSRECVFQLLNRRDNEYFNDLKVAYKWFNNTLQIISPNTKPIDLINKLSKDELFFDFAKKTLCSYDIGLSSIELVDHKIDNDGNELYDPLKRRIEDSKNNEVIFPTPHGETLKAFIKDEDIWIKSLKLEHKSIKDKKLFDLKDESDGTLRLLDFLLVFYRLNNIDAVFIIDEIERSIHPVLIKELIKKFSADENTKGQLIFTTHESNLLDQDIFRTDEIWFAEKDKSGSTDLYSLSDFKEHKTTDIRKGYLNGRYGAIPFMGNLADLNWN